MKKLLVLVLTLFMVVGLAACSGGSTTPTDGGDTATPVTYTYAIGDQPSYMDPAVATDSIGSYVINQMFFPMFYLGPDGITPAAAESYEVSDDNLTYTIKLVENYWSDGQKVTADDYVYGVKHALSIGGAEASYLSWVTDYVVGAAQYEYSTSTDMPELGVVALDENTVQITLMKEVPFFTSLLWGGVYYPLREDFAPMGDYTWADTVGYPMCGAYYPTYIDRADKIEFAKNENWVWADQCGVDVLVCKVIADMDAELMAFQSGEIDYASSVEAATVSKMPELADNFFATGVINYYIEFNCYDNGTNSDDPMMDVNVRKAIQYGIDREAICAARDDGVTFPLYGFVPSGLVADEGDFRAVGGDYMSYDPDLAKEYLAAAGYSVDNPLQLEYYYNQNSAHDLVAAVLKEQLKAIGIELTLKTADVRTFFADRDENGNFQIARGAMSADYSDPLAYLDMATTTFQMNKCWGDDYYDEIMLTAASQSGQERMDTLHAAEKYLVEETAQVCPLFEYGSACLKSTAFTGDIDNMQGNSIFWFVKPAN
ncbi:MAG: peptide ABC transporter substrate-binding protein [Erysipelotrichaceae bacterium]|nr:peptide ABC transporter substrate-binding protein [Erysipelotrichaceae bacterium]